MSAYGRSRWFMVRYSCCPGTWLRHIWLRTKHGEKCARCGEVLHAS